MATNVKIKIYTEKVNRAVDDSATKRMHQAVNVLRNQTLETLSGNRSGKTYKVPGTNRTYTASSPGQPPAIATSDLIKSIETTVKGEGSEIIGTVGTKLPYGLWLERGTQDIEPRPWLRVSLDKSIAKLRRIFTGQWL